MELMNGMDVRASLLEEYKEVIDNEELDISLAIIQVGDNPESNKYIKNKLKYTEMVGINSKLYKLDSDVSENELLKLIDNLNKDSKVTGIILQSPTPSHIDFSYCARSIDVSKDVDGFCEENLFGIRDNHEKVLPCTVKGILRILDYYDIDISGRDIVVIGRSNIVGRPLADALINRDATVTVCHSKTRDLEKHTKNADIVVSAVGSANLITPDMVRDGFVGVDVGINFVDGKLVGDFNKDCYEKASYITPVPGGVGPMTVAMIIDNLIDLKRLEKNKKVYTK